MTREQLVALARRLDTADGTEEELQEIMNVLVRTLPHGDILQLLYHTRPELSADDAVDEAMRRQRAWEEDSRTS